MDKLLSYHNNINKTNSISDQNKLKNDMYNYYIKNNSKESNKQNNNYSTLCNSSSYTYSLSNSINSGSITGFNSNNSLTCYTR